MKKTDAAILLGILLLSLLPLVFLLNGDAGAWVTVSKNGAVVYRAPIGRDAVIALGGNTVTVEGGRVYMSDADCPDRICIETGDASRAKPIVCLPNGVVVTVEGEEASGLDAIAG